LLIVVGVFGILLSKIKVLIYILLNPTELCGTPGYLSPEVLQCSMFPDAPGYGKEVDM